MKKTAHTLLLSLLCLNIFAQKVTIIPAPVKTVSQKGIFVLPRIIDISAKGVSGNTVAFLKEKLSKATGYKVFVNRNIQKPTITLTTNRQPDTSIGKEGYKLSVTTTNIKIKANQSAGLYYGVQSLLQLLPSKIESPTVQNISWKIPAVEITDYPRFAWRGLMLDVARHFSTKEDVKLYINNMAKYKFNLLHFHLTDDEGWRVEIKSYPNLTKKGAYNAERVGYFGSFAPPPTDEARTYGGFYTQEDIKELVAYAKERFVDIMPEVDVPGHSLAAVVSYPELSYTRGAENYQVRSGEVIIDWIPPHPLSRIDNNLNPANPKVYVFLDKVFSELSTLFPFEYIHIGGDECIKNFWEKDSAVIELAKRENLKNMNEVQSYFTKKIVKIISDKGKKAIGWDEILEGGLADGAAVMSWRGEKGGIDASSQGHEVVMSPTQYCYLDYMQGDSVLESRVYSTLLLNKAYSYEPIIAGINGNLVKGIQANLWSEQLYNRRYVEYMTWPRAMATAEVAWTKPENKNWDSFEKNVENHFNRFDAAEVNYSTAMYDPTIKVEMSKDSALVTTLTSQLVDLDIHYSWDNSPPDAYYPTYKTPLTIPKGASQLKIVSYRGKKKMGRLMAVSVESLKRRVGR